MVVGWIVNQPVGIARSAPRNIAGVAHIHAKGAVVDRVAAFVQNDKNLRRNPDLLALGKDLDRKSVV